MNLTKLYLNKGVIGNEADFPLNIFESSPNFLQKCIENKIPSTVHAGEFPVILLTNKNIEIVLKYENIKLTYWTWIDIEI